VGKLDQLEQRVAELVKSNRRCNQLAKILVKEKKALSSITDNAPYGVCINRGKFGAILYLNREFTNITGYTREDIPTVPVWSYKAYPNTKYRRSLAGIWKKMVDSRKGSALYRIVCKDGAVKDIETSLVVLKDQTVVNMFVDVTRREAAETALREGEEKFRLLFDQSADAVLLLRGTGLIDCNQAAQRMFGSRERGLILGGTLRNLFPLRQPDGILSLARFKEMIAAANRDRTHRFEWTLKRFNGSTFPADVMLTAIPFRGKRILYMVLRDISARKLTEHALQRARDDLETRVQERTTELVAINRKMLEEIEVRKGMERQLQRSRQQLRRLSEHLQSAQEEERSRIAREVHDELGQMLSALKIDVACLGDRLHMGDHALFEESRSITDRIDTAIQAVRTICSQLRPTVLDHFGLAAAIEWQLKDLERRTRIQCTASLDPDIPLLEKELSLMLFRVFQEAVTNIMRHSGATRVRVKLLRKADNLLLRIDDNGKGIAKEEIADPESFGIMGIRERVRFWGGQTSFKGVAGKGTSVTISLPLNRETCGAADGGTIQGKEDME